MKLKVNSRKSRTQTGSAFIELAAIGFILPVVAIMVVNVGVLMFAAGVNDAACRNAARAAAQQTNPEDAKVAAASAAKQFATGGGIFGNPLVLQTKDMFEFETFPDKDGVPQVEKGPYVRVSTRLNTQLPAPIIFNGTGFTGLITFKQSYVFPIANPDQTLKSTPQFDPGQGQQEEDQLTKAAEAAAQAAAAAASAGTSGGTT